MALDIATISYLPEPVRSEIDQLKILASKKFNSKKVLDWNPHITIANRVLIPENKEEEIFSKIRELCKNTEPFNSQTTDELHILKVPNSPFENPYGIFIEVEVNDKLLELHHSIQNKIFHGLDKPSYKSDHYRPHVTLAYRDLTKENFEKAKKYFQENPINTKHVFKVDNLQLATQNKDGTWSSYKSFKLGR